VKKKKDELHTCCMPSNITANEIHTLTVLITRFVAICLSAQTYGSFGDRLYLQNKVYLRSRNLGV
jgi:hypothetical protein